MKLKMTDQEHMQNKHMWLRWGARGKGFSNPTFSH